MLAVTVLLVLLLGAINLINLGMVQRDLKDTLQMVADRVDKPDNDLVNTAYFLVKIAESGEVASVDVAHVTSVDEEQAASYALKIYEKYSGGARRTRCRETISRRGNGRRSSTRWKPTGGKRMQPG